MIVTGRPATSLLATCGSDPLDLAAPLGGRQGTRLKISPADFATALTLSIALVVRLFGWLAWSTDATLPVPAAPVVWRGTAWLRSGLPLSGLAASGGAGR